MRNETTWPKSIAATELRRTGVPEQADAVLIERIGRGDRTAMRQLYARHHLRIYRFILRMVNDEALAEDLTSEVYISTWLQAHRFEGRSSVTTWLLTIARNKAIAAMRRRREVSLDENIQIASEEDNPEVTLQSKHRGEILRKCLTQLSPNHREVIDLVYYHERSVQEAADIIGIPCNTVKTRMYYARRRLFEMLRSEGVAEARS
jgi:RNA polymerase sigma-70 factor (ECF subfamily)